MNSIFAVSNRWYKLRKAGGEKQKFSSNLFMKNCFEKFGRRNRQKTSRTNLKTKNQAYQMSSSSSSKGGLTGETFDFPTKAVVTTNRDFYSSPDSFSFRTVTTGNINLRASLKTPCTLLLRRRVTG